MGSESERSILKSGRANYIGWVAAFALVVFCLYVRWLTQRAEEATRSFRIFVATLDAPWSD
jgi:hypothetical protein